MSVQLRYLALGIQKIYTSNKIINISYEPLSKEFSDDKKAIEYCIDNCNHKHKKQWVVIDRGEFNNNSRFIDGNGKIIWIENKISDSP